MQSYWWLCVCSPEGVECWKEHGREDRQDFRGILSTAEFVGLLLGVQPSGLWWLMVMESQDHVKGTWLRLAREGVWKGKGGETGAFEGVKCQILS